MPSQHNATTASLLEFDSSIPYNIFIRNLKLLRAGQVVVDFNIILDKNRVIFYGPPDKNKSRTVRGKVRLEVAGKLHVKEIMLTLAGEFHIINENSDSISDEKPLQGTLFSTCILLANKRTLVPGIHEFFFEFLLPGDLPESMSSDLVLCEYFLKAELVSRGPDDLSAAQNKIVDVVDLSVQRTLLQTDEHIKQGLGATRYTGSRDKILDYEFLIPRIMKLDSDTFTFHARWDGLRVDNVKFWFVQTENFKNLRSKEGDESLPDRKSKIISGPFCFDLPKKEPLKLQSRPMVFQLPITQPLVRDYELSNVEIRHKLVISIQMANKNKELISLSIPITIESIVSDVDMIPPPCHISKNNQAALLHFANKIYSGKSIEDNDQPKLSSSSSSTPSSSFKRFIRTERRRHTVLIDQSSESTTKAESVDQPTFQISRRSSSVVRGRRSSNNNNVNVINTQNSISTIIESASEYSVDESSQDNTIATTVTYTNNTEHEKNSNGFPQKGTHKSSFSGNMIAEKFNKFRNRGNAKKRISRASSSASTARFAPGLIEVISMRPDTNIANINNTSLTT
ncbi:uncharacterized protein OCT59_010254 [Rhizophagus irregularis]|uniref:Arrestin-like N-terminal domain-containing protein n=2 Tax=Rhizophagus irregularis TaxID=588596 RepID=U9ULM2_RHIID|nr:hypothetical protein GLOIN_2v1555527 [Rhizophagus irregularis DAOM 181602=DAOM 197198]EXX77386.1 hypothetical protein RirG_024140 [Rhizophagus irregularis DAOM 197198w]POG76566.1 hypothetical protein GLOIN_2v1555527 [Rhizophagus irregularis DAOM 181602=DAOM 197198]UZO18947.1 hypothetical protein OCT59_010254 [Rhizophagus irregularis]GBC30277.1 arrestin domain containing protein, putative [Rhizophagus irregularis DAOM 181602=DAOM 197198]|eukprot:XP_025183432.1 hypothetical protein GLOIN_2v1555527 [Rhizophagus irregularis DAOM 181602=DAOM 197198]